MPAPGCDTARRAGVARSAVPIRPGSAYTPPVARPILAGAFLGLWLATACGGPPAAQPARAAPTSGHGPDAASPTASAAAPSPAAPETAPAPPASDPAPLAPTEAPLPKAPDAGFDFEVWCADHQVDANLDVDGCEPAHLGDAPDDTLWCLRHEQTKDGRVLYFQGLYLPRAKHLVKSFELLVGVGSLDLPDNPTRDIERYLVKLVASPAEDHKSVAFTDSAERGCDKALADNADKYSRDPGAGKLQRDAIQRVCKARGHYAWLRGGALRRTGK